MPPMPSSAKPSRWRGLAARKRPLNPSPCGAARSPQPVLFLTVGLRRGAYRYLMQENKPGPALEIFDRLVSTFGDYLPALIEKAKVHMALNDWEMAVSTAERCLAIDRHCIDAHRVLILNQLCRVGNGGRAASALGNLIDAVNTTEPKNHWLFYKCSLAPTRLAGGDHRVLMQTRELIDRAIDLCPANADYINELAYHLVINAEYEAAAKQYKEAMSLDSSNVKSLYGQIRIQLETDKLDDARNQLDFLKEIQSSNIGDPVELSYLSALMASKQRTQAVEIFSILDAKLPVHLRTCKEQAITEDYFELLNPAQLLLVVGLYMQYGPTDPPAEGDAPPPVLVKCSRALEVLTRAAPGMIEAVYTLALIKFLMGDAEAAKSGAVFCLQQDKTHTDSHLLMAKLFLYAGNMPAASNALEDGLSCVFDIEKSPGYLLIMAKILAADGKHEKSIQTLAKAMRLPGVRRAVGAGQAKSKHRVVSLSERVSVYLQLAAAYSSNGQEHEAAKVMQDAMQEFQGSAEEMRIQIANADLAVQRGDIEAALRMLNEVTPDHSYYVGAKEKMAKIYLEYRKDKELYVACYKDLVSRNPTAHTCLLLGDALMMVHRPEEAIKVYQGAMKKTGDKLLASKVGSALIKTHEYKKAILFYETGLQEGGQLALRADLAQLYLKMHDYAKCERCLLAGLDEDQSNTLEGDMHYVRYAMLLAQMHKEKGTRLGGGDPGVAISWLEKARDKQKSVLKLTAVERPDNLQQQKSLAADICIEMALLHQGGETGDVKATQLFQEALSYDERNAKATVALAKLYLARGDLETAESGLNALLATDATNNEATMLMAEVKFRQKENEAATNWYQKVLDREPNHFQALSSLIDLLRRAGELTGAVKFITQAKKASPRAETEPGLNYCRGMYHRWQGETNLALKRFNLCRNDSEFGIQAQYHMVELYLNPEDETLGGDTFSSQERDQGSISDCIREARTLLHQLKLRGQGNQLKFRCLLAHCDLAGKSRQDIEKALAEFTSLVAQDPEYVPGILGLAQAYMLNKQTPKARHQLKRIKNLKWTAEMAEEFEKAWLLLADIFISSGKNDQAQDCLKRCLVHNKSCCKAWEYEGHIFEKEAAYKDAASFYENAWTYGNKRNLTIGYKLAFNYYKDKRYADAIGICHHLLKVEPDYPRVQRDILDKCRASLRT